MARTKSHALKDWTIRPSVTQVRVVKGKLFTVHNLDTNCIKPEGPSFKRSEVKDLAWATKALAENIAQDAAGKPRTGYFCEACLTEGHVFVEVADKPKATSGVVKEAEAIVAEAAKPAAPAKKASTKVVASTAGTATDGKAVPAQRTKRAARTTKAVAPKA